MEATTERFMKRRNLATLELAKVRSGLRLYFLLTQTCRCSIWLRWLVCLMLKVSPCYCCR
jgi:hypothetical protein